MKKRSPAAPAALAMLLPALILSLSVPAQTQPPTPKETLVTAHATGPFDVKLAPQPLADAPEGSMRGRMSIDKQYHGDLEATAQGEMLTAGTSVKGSAAYVAIEEVSGTLHGRKGTFSLHHRGIMTRGAPELVITVVPDSGTDQLVGITGEMAIRIEDGKHFYDLEYTLPGAP